MSKVPQLQPPRSTTRHRNASPWADLIAFVSVLALGAVLMILGHITAGSLATICAALGGLYAVWKRLRSSDASSSSDDSDASRDTRD
jgi:hypothetical protein